MKSVFFAVVAACTVQSAFTQATNIVNSTGNIGIGTTNPTAQTEIYRSAGASPSLFRLNTGFPGGNAVDLNPFITGVNNGGFELSIAGNRRLVIDTQGNVGVGTLNPQQLLHVSGGNPVLLLRSTGPGARGLWTKVDDTNGAVVFDSSYNSVGAYPFSFRLGGVEALQISTTGNCGIGVTPNEKVDVAGSVQVQGSGAGSNRIVLKDTSANPRSWEWYPQGGGPNSLMLYERVSNLSALTILAPSGNVGIGTANPTQKLSVNGTVRAKEVIVETAGWSDYVLAKDYALAPLSEVEKHIQKEGRLPGIPSAQEVAEKGVGVGEMQAKLLAKIEELTLHQIEQEKELRRLRSRVAELEHR